MRDKFIRVFENIFGLWKGEDDSNSMDRISALPRDILQRILYFLPQKEAVRTSVLSKSWLYIWYTRPNLDFSDTNFRGDKLSVVDKILQRYCDQRLRLEEFHLFIEYCLESNHWFVRRGTPLDEWVWLLDKWIPLLTTTMGLKKFRLSSDSDYYRTVCPLPPVVFGAESLQDLHLEGFKLNKNAIERIVLFKHLRSLRLKCNTIKVEILQKIIASCPLIETLKFEGGIKSVRTINLNDLHNLKNLSFSHQLSNDYEEVFYSNIEVHPPSLETIYINGCNIWFHEGADFRNLSGLHLVSIKSSLAHLFSCQFPSLKCLTLDFCVGLEKESHVFIDAPNILSFKYEGHYFVPSISFATTLNEWKSDISIYSDDASTLWFLKLKQLLKSLSQSKISLRIGPCDKIRENTMVQDSDYDKPVVVECLYLNRGICLSSLSSLLNVMFGICRPRNIGNFLYKEEMRLVAFQWKILMERGSRRQDQLTQLLFRDLEEVSFEMKERNREEWHPATLSDFILISPRSEIFDLKSRQSEWRFALKWRETFSRASSSSTPQMSGLRYRNEKCKHQNCGKETTITIWKTSSDSGRLYYSCSDHGYSHWCHPL